MLTPFRYTYLECPILNALNLLKSENFHMYNFSFLNLLFRSHVSNSKNIKERKKKRKKNGSRLLPLFFLSCFFHLSRYLLPRFLHYAAGICQSLAAHIKQYANIQQHPMTLCSFSPFNSTRIVSLSRGSNCSFTTKCQEDPLYRF